MDLVFEESTNRRIMRGCVVLFFCLVGTPFLLVFFGEFMRLRLASGTRMTSSNHMKQIAIGIHGHHNQHKQLPASAIFSKDNPSTLSRPGIYLRASW